jgi:hypothetical protein
MLERRNYQRRAEVFGRVTAWLREQKSPARPPSHLAEPIIAGRILKRLSFRGLAWCTPSGWLPSPVLVSSSERHPGRHRGPSRRIVTIRSGAWKAIGRAVLLSVIVYAALIGFARLLGFARS